MKRVIVVNSKTAALWLALVSLIGMAGCRQGEKSLSAAKTFSGDRPIKVTVTVGMVADIVREIGGEHVEVTQLMGSGVDPHLKKATRDDTQALIDADIVFYNGLMLEGKMAETLKNISHKVHSIAAAEALPEGTLKTDPTQHGHPDPHVWMNVAMWSQVAQHIGDEFARFDPERKSDYVEATAKLRAKLDRLHQYGVQVIGCIPVQQRVLVTSHDAFRYFGEAYSIEVESLQGISTESEATLERMLELKDLLVEKKITAVFRESSVPEKAIEALIRGAADRNHDVRIADSLYSDAMGAEGHEATYIGMMDHNFTTIARALGCPNVPADGFRGWKADAQDLDAADEASNE